MLGNCFHFLRFVKEPAQGISENEILANTTLHHVLHYQYWDKHSTMVHLCQPITSTNASISLTDIRSIKKSIKIGHWCCWLGDTKGIRVIKNHAKHPKHFLTKNFICRCTAEKLWKNLILNCLSLYCLPPMLLYCWLGTHKGIWPAKITLSQNITFAIFTKDFLLPTTLCFKKSSPFLFSQ